MKTLDWKKTYCKKFGLCETEDKGCQCKYELKFIETLLNQALEAGAKAKELSLRGEMVERVKELKDVNFPLGERKWCIECQKRICAEVLKIIKG
jgi:hypothetical protein